MENVKYGIIGCGNIGKAIIKSALINIKKKNIILLQYLKKLFAHISWQMDYSLKDDHALIHIC